jgi:hypothetical protein
MKKSELKLKPPETIIRKYGYEYHLVSVDREGLFRVPDPCIFGMKGFALKSVNKIKHESDR